VRYAAIGDRHAAALTAGVAGLADTHGLEFVDVFHDTDSTTPGSADPSTGRRSSGDDRTAKHPAWIPVPAVDRAPG